MITTPCHPDAFAAHYKFNKRKIRALVRQHGLGYKVGRNIALEDKDIKQLQELIRNQPCHTISRNPAAGKTGASVGLTTKSQLTDLVEHLSRPKPKKSPGRGSAKRTKRRS